jgi:hypothetical protein
MDLGSICLLRALLLANPQIAVKYVNKLLRFYALAFKKR